MSNSLKQSKLKAKYLSHMWKVLYNEITMLLAKKREQDIIDLIKQNKANKQVMAMRKINFKRKATIVVVIKKYWKLSSRVKKRKINLFSSKLFKYQNQFSQIKGF